MKDCGRMIVEIGHMSADVGVSIERDCFESFDLGWNSDH